MTKKYAYSYNGEKYIGEFDTEKEALKEAISEAEFDTVDIYIGICEKPDNPSINASYVIDQIIDDYSSNYGELADDYLMHITTQEAEELEAELNKTFMKWAKKYKHLPGFFTVNAYKVYSYENGKAKVGISYEKSN